MLEIDIESEDNNPERESLKESQPTATPEMKEPISKPSINIHQTQGPTEGLEEDSEMITSKIGLEDMELSDMLEQEGMDLPNMVEN